MNTKPDLSVRLDQLSDRDIGRWIVWTDPNLGTVQKGRLKSWNELFCFVVFKCNDDWIRFENYSAEACAPRECRFLAPKHETKISDLRRPYE